MTQHLSISPLPDNTRRGQTVERLKGLIVSGELKAGSRLTEQGLASALGISRGPLREAIRELVDIGLLVSKPYKGLFVRNVTRKDLEEIYSLRTLLEQFAFRACWDKRSAAAEQDLRARGRDLIDVIDRIHEPMEVIESELHLHSWCYELADHTLLMQSWRRLAPNLQFYFMMHQRAHGRPGPVRNAHDVYIELACGDDLDAMLAHLGEHMQQGLERTMSFIENHGRAVSSDA